MHRDRDGESLSFVERRLPEGFAARSLMIPAGCDRAYEQDEWADSIIVLEEGEIELECLAGTRSRFAAGAVLCFDSLPLRTLRNTGREPALLIAVSRRAHSDRLVPACSAPPLAPHDAWRALRPSVSSTDELTLDSASHE